MKKILYGLFVSFLLGCSTFPNLKNESGIYIAASILLPRKDEAYSRIKRNDKIELEDILVEKIFVYNGDIYSIASERWWEKIDRGSILVCKAVYYKNNRKYYPETEMDYSSAKSIYIDKGDVYILGEEYNLGTRLGEMNSRSVYWKNGKKYNIAVNHTDSNENNIYAIDLYVDNGNTYILGAEDGIPKYCINGESFQISGIPDIMISNYIDGMPIYLKNGESFQISGIPDIMILNSIFAYNGDVYVIGSENSGERYIGRDGNERRKKVAKYWKNGIGINLSDGKNEAHTTDIFVNSTGVYIIGVEETGKAYIFPEYYDDDDFYFKYQNEPTIKLWINDQEYKFEESVSSSNKLFFDNNNLYIFGYKNNVPVIWKNLTPQNISNITKSDYTLSQINSLYVENDNLYVSESGWGDEKSIVKLFKNNGTEVNIPKNDELLIPRSIYIDNEDTLILIESGVFWPEKKIRYWKNNTLSNVLFSGNCWGEKIRKINGDIYITCSISASGTEESLIDSAIYWKNDEIYHLPLEEKTARASTFDVMLLENYLYIIGLDNDKVKIWKNGIEYMVLLENINFISNLEMYADENNDIIIYIKGNCWKEKNKYDASNDFQKVYKNFIEIDVNSIEVFNQLNQFVKKYGDRSVTDFFIKGNDIYIARKTENKLYVYKNSTLVKEMNIGKDFSVCTIFVK